MMERAGSMLIPSLVAWAREPTSRGRVIASVIIACETAWRGGELPDEVMRSMWADLRACPRPQLLEWLEDAYSRWERRVETRPVREQAPINWEEAA